MNGTIARLFALWGLASLFSLPLLVVAWLLFPKKRSEPDPETDASVAAAASFIVQGR